MKNYVEVTFWNNEFRIFREKSLLFAFTVLGSNFQLFKISRFPFENYQIVCYDEPKKPYQNLCRIVSMAIFNSLKLISRKICVKEKIFKFYNVLFFACVILLWIYQNLRPPQPLMRLADFATISWCVITKITSNRFS